MNENEYYGENTAVIKKKRFSGTGVIIILFSLFAIVPFFLITGASVLFVYSLEFEERQNCTYETDATVVDYIAEERYKKNNTKYQYYPVYSYGYGGNEYRAKGTHSLPDKKYEIGERTTVFVNPDNSEEFFDKNYSLMRVENNPFVLIFYIFFVLLVVDIAVVILYNRAYKAKSAADNDYN